MLGSYIIYYEDGSAESSLSEQLPAGSCTYTETEIVMPSFNDYDKMLISEDGTTITWNYNGAMKMVYTLESATQS